jgi:TRAP-type mannitol/chloroaromatic compound transport system permease small subunit
MRRVLEVIDLVTSRVGEWASLLFLPVTLIAMFEVVMRYAFNRPTTWAWDVNVQLFSLIVVLGAGHTLQQKGHVIMDIVVSRLSERRRLLVNVVVYAVFVLAMLIVVWQVGVFAWRSISLGERASTLFAPPVYPLKVAIFVGVTVLCAQAVSVLLRDLASLRDLTRQRRGA